MKIVGYARVSNNFQPCTQQEQILKAEGCTDVETDIHSGESVSIKLENLCEQLENGDILKVVQVDRISRKPEETLELIERFVNKGIRVVSIIDGFDTLYPNWREYFR